MTCFNSNTDDWFIELESTETEETLPEWIECYIIENIDPTICGPLSKDLSSILPLRCPGTKSDKSSTETITLSTTQYPKTDHLKRTRRRAATEHELNLRANSDNAPIQKLPSSSSSSEDKTTSFGKKLTSGDVESGDISTENKFKEHNTKKRKQKSKQSNWSLDVLVGSVQQVNDTLNTSSTTQNEKLHSLQQILTKYGLSIDESQNSLTYQSLPGRPAKNKEERDEWNLSVWPTLFFEKKTTQFKQEEKALSSEEIDLMKHGMQEALADAMMGNGQWREWKEQMGPTSDRELSLSISGAVVIDPQTDSVVSRASQERKLQCMDRDAVSFPEYVNPLSSAPLLAIQGVSRIERHVAISNGMESDEFRGGQYLCTGYDVYLTKEPNIFEAMSLVHSRVRRVIFGIPDTGMGGLGGPKSSNGQDAGVHSLPGTNHHYRAFRLNLSDGSGCVEEDMSLRRSLVAKLNNLHPEKEFKC